MSGTQVPGGTIVQRAWIIRGEVGGLTQRWGAVVLSVPGEAQDRCHICWDDPGHGIRASRSRGDTLKLVEVAQRTAVKFSAALGDVAIRRYGGGSLQEFQDWFRAKEEEDLIPTPPSDDSLEEFEELLK